MTPQKEITSFLLTRSVILNSLAQMAANDLKEHTKANDKVIFNGIRNPLQKVINDQQALHDIYKKVIPEENMIFWKKLDEISALIDANLLH